MDNVDQHQCRTKRYELLNANGGQIDSIYTDLEKAFDKILHKKLLLKLRNYSMHPRLINWIECFLCHRKQCVKVNGKLSHWLNVLSLRTFNQCESLLLTFTLSVEFLREQFLVLYCLLFTLTIYQRCAKIYAVFFCMQTMSNYTNMFYKMRIILIYRLL